MKRFTTIALAIVAALFVSCNKDDSTGLEGEWIVFRDDYHPLTITFQGSDYDYYVKGIAPRRDKGTFSYDGQYLTLSPKEYYELDPETDKMSRINSSDATFSQHKYQVLAFDGNVLVAKSLVNDFYNEGMITYWTRGDDNQSLEANALKGTWVGSTEYTKYIFIFDGSSYTFYEINHYSFLEGEEWKEVPGSVKEQGTWKHAKGVLSLTPSKKYYSFSREQVGYDYNYTYYPVNEETGEAETWVEETGTLYPTEYELHLSGKAVYVNMGWDAVAFTKK